jgi:hypothetical protein
MTGWPRAPRGTSDRIGARGPQFNMNASSNMTELFQTTPGTSVWANIQYLIHSFLKDQTNRDPRHRFRRQLSRCCRAPKRLNTRQVWGWRDALLPSRWYNFALQAHDRNWTDCPNLLQMSAIVSYFANFSVKPKGSSKVLCVTASKCVRQSGVGIFSFFNPFHWLDIFEAFFPSSLNFCQYRWRFSIVRMRISLLFID